MYIDINNYTILNPGKLSITQEFLLHSSVRKDKLINNLDELGFLDYWNFDFRYPRIGWKSIS